MCVVCVAGRELCPCHHFLELSPIAPMDHYLAWIIGVTWGGGGLHASMTVSLLLQGGGVVIEGGNANFNDCQIYNNKADYVSACLLPFPELSSMAPMD